MGIATAVGKVDKALTTLREMLFSDFSTLAHSDKACHDTQFKAVLSFLINEYLNLYKYPSNWLEVYRT